MVSNELTISFETVPEVPIEGVNSMYSVIRAHQRMELPSYGAYVIRHAGIDGARKYAEDLQPNHNGASSKPELKTTNFKCTPIDAMDSEVLDWDIPLHYDEGEENSVTSHVTYGSANFILVAGILPANGFSHRFTNSLYARAILPTQAVVGIEGIKPLTEAGSVKVWTTVVGNEDVVVFDHSLPHAFITVGDKRQSHAFYYS